MTDVNKEVDIISCISRLRAEFKRAGMEVPSSINLKSHEEGQRLLFSIAQVPLIVMNGNDIRIVEMADGSMYREIKVMDIAIRWPANKIATADGSWRFV